MEDPNENYSPEEREYAKAKDDYDLDRFLVKAGVVLSTSLFLYAGHEGIFDKEIGDGIGYGVLSLVGFYFTYKLFKKNKITKETLKGLAEKLASGKL